MITISVLGLDQYVVGHYSKENSANLTSLFECGEEDINFYAPNSMVFHNGVEQTSWNTIIIVKAPTKYSFAEKAVADYLMKTMKEFSINLQIQFEYFSDEAVYELINDDYPRYIREDNIVTEGEEPSGEDDDTDEDNDEPNPRDRADLDPDDPNQLYLGNAFEKFDKEMAEQENSDYHKGPKGK